MLLSFLPEHLKELGVADSSIGMVMGIYSLSSFLLMVPLGFLSDGISPKKVLLLGAAATWSHILGLRTAWKTWHFLSLAMLGGLGWTIFQVVLFALYLKVITAEDRGKKIAFFHAGQFLGFGIGPLFAGVLWGWMDYRSTLDFAIAAAVLLNVCLLGLPDAAPLSLDWQGYRHDLTQKRTFLFLLVYFVFATHFGVEQTAHTLFMRRELAFSNWEIGFSYFVTGIWMGLLAPIAGHRFDLQQKVVVFLGLGLLCCGVFQVGTAWVHDLKGMILLRLLHTLGDTPVILALGIMTAAYFPKGRMGGNSAVIYTVRVLGTFLGSVLAGFAAPLVGYGGTFVYNGIFIVLGTFCLLPLMQRQFGQVPHPP